MARDDLGVVVGEREKGVRRRDHAIDGAAVGEVDVGIAGTQRHDVAGRQDIRIGKVHVGVTVGMGIGEVLQGRLASSDLHRHLRRVGPGRDRPLRRGWGLGAGQSVGGAGAQTLCDILMRRHDGTILGEALVAARMVAMEMRVDEIADRLLRDGCDRRRDLVMQRRELAVDHDDAVVAHRGGDVAAHAFDHVGPVPEIGGLHLHLGIVGLGIGLACHEQEQTQNRCRNLRSCS